MEATDWITGGIAIAALILGIVQAATTAARENKRDRFEKRSTDEAVEVQRKLLEIEEQRHAWEQEERTTDAAERQSAGEHAQTAEMVVRFAFRDSARTWARILATNSGPADATDVVLAIHAEREGHTGAVEPIGGTDYGTAERLQASESVHVAVAFTFGSPQPEDLRYRLTWVDGRGDQERQGRVPVE